MVNYFLTSIYVHIYLWDKVPGNDLRKVNKSTGLIADLKVLDLEDGVPFDQKPAARKIIADIYNGPNTGSIFARYSDYAIRLNSLDSGFLKDDLEIFKLIPVRSVVLTKINSPGCVTSILSKLSKFDQLDRFNIFLTIESAKGIINLPEIVKSFPEAKALIVSYAVL